MFPFLKAAARRAPEPIKTMRVLHLELPPSPLVELGTCRMLALEDDEHEIRLVEGYALGVLFRTPGLATKRDEPVFASRAYAMLTFVRTRCIGRQFNRENDRKQSKHC